MKALRASSAGREGVRGDFEFAHRQILEQQNHLVLDVAMREATGYGGLKTLDTLRREVAVGCGIQRRIENPST